MSLEQTQTLWNSLEISKLIISALTPIIVAALAFQFNRLLKKREKIQWTNQKIIEKRIEIYDSIVPKLNDLLCYYSYIGNWKEFEPRDVVNIKRYLDKQVNIYAPLFKEDVLGKYKLLINLCFESFSGWGEDAKIKSHFVRRKECHEKWEDSWEWYFSRTYIDSHADDELIRQDIITIREKYLSLLESLKNDLEIFQTGFFQKNDFPMINFK